MKDTVVTAASAQESGVPGYGADTALVATHGLHKLVLCGVPDLKLTGMSADCE